MHFHTIRRGFGVAAALLLAGAITTGALATPERPEMPADRELSLTVLLKGYPGGR